MSACSPQEGATCMVYICIVPGGLLMEGPHSYDVTITIPVHKIIGESVMEGRIICSPLDDTNDGNREPVRRFS